MKCCISNVKDGSKDIFMDEEDDQSGFKSYDEDDMHPDFEITQNEFAQLFIQLKFESELEGFV